MITQYVLDRLNMNFTMLDIAICETIERARNLRKGCIFTLTDLYLPNEREDLRSDLKNLGPLGKRFYNAVTNEFKDTIKFVSMNGPGGVALYEKIA